MFSLLRIYRSFFVSVILSRFSSSIRVVLVPPVWSCVPSGFLLISRVLFCFLICCFLVFPHLCNVSPSSPVSPLPFPCFLSMSLVFCSLCFWSLLSPALVFSPPLLFSSISFLSYSLLPPPPRSFSFRFFFSLHLSHLRFSSLLLFFICILSLSLLLSSLLLSSLVFSFSFLLVSYFLLYSICLSPSLFVNSSFLLY